MNIEQITKSVCTLCEETGDFILHEMDQFSREDVREKGESNYVTYVDEEAEQRLLAGLSGLVPGCGFIAEESPGLETAEYTWIIDPLDGTTNFIHGIPLFSISIALKQGEKIISGVVYEVGRKEMFYTWKGAASFLNGKEIRVSDTSLMRDSLFATGFPYYDYSKMEEYLGFFKYLMVHSRGLRRLGSAAADLAYVACGRFEGFYEYGLSPWDVAAGSLLVRNAGGMVTDFSGGENFLFGREIIAVNSDILPSFMKHFRECFQT